MNSQSISLFSYKACILMTKHKQNHTCIVKNLRGPNSSFFARIEEGRKAVNKYDHNTHEIIVNSQ